MKIRPGSVKGGIDDLFRVGRIPEPLLSRIAVQNALWRTKNAPLRWTATCFLANLEFEHLGL
jgi:hypothetical protein